MQKRMTTHQRLTATTVEGLYWLTALLLRLAETVLLFAAITAETIAGYLAVLAAAAGYSLLLAPVRLGRQMWYSRLEALPGRTPPIRTLWAGCRRWRAAVGWRWSRWWRQTALLLLLSLPAALLWGYGDRVTRLGEPTYSLVWLVLGALALLFGVAVVCIRRCRYSLVPLLLAQGYSAALAVQLSIHLTRRRTGEWLDFWGSQAGRLALCLLPGGMLWALPPVRLAYTALLTDWLRGGLAATAPVTL